MKKHWIAVLFVLLTVIVLVLAGQSTFSLDRLLSWQPENLMLAAVILLVVYAVKSLLVFIPIMIPQVLVGHLYPKGAAFLLNLLGLIIIVAFPHWIGKKRGAKKMEQILGKYPKVQKLLKAQDENQMAFSFMLRACAVPPADVVTMYLGAAGISASTNLIGGVLGCFPSMVMTTFLGANIHDPKSPAFWIALMLNILWIALSALSFYLFQRIKNKEVPNE